MWWNKKRKLQHLFDETSTQQPRARPGQTSRTSGETQASRTWSRLVPISPNRGTSPYAFLPAFAQT